LWTAISNPECEPKLIVKWLRMRVGATVIDPGMGIERGLMMLPKKMQQRFFQLTAPHGGANGSRALVPACGPPLG